MTRAQQQELERQATELIRVHGGSSVVDPEEQKARKRARIEQENDAWDEDAGREFLHSQSEGSEAFDDDCRPCAVSHDDASTTGTSTDRALGLVTRVSFEVGRWAGRKDAVKEYAANVALYLVPEDTRTVAMSCRVSERFVRRRVKEAREIVKMVSSKAA